MPIRQSKQGGGGRDYLEVDLQLSPLELNLTAVRSALRDGQASLIVGRDVLHPGRLAKAPRRRPITLSFPPGMGADLDLAQGGHPLTTAIPCNMRGNVIKRQTYNSGPVNTLGVLYKYVGVAPSVSNIYLTAAGVDRYVDWPQAAKDALLAGRNVSIIFDDHLPPAGGVRPKSVRRFYSSNGLPAFEFGSLDVPSEGMGFPLDETWATPSNDDGIAGYNFFATSAAAGFNFTLSWPDYFDKRGLWVSNGRKFWLLQNGIYTQYLDLGASSGALGLEWRGAQISPDVFMFVHPSMPPRIIPLEAEPRSGTLNEVDATRYLAGILAPDLGQRDYPPAQFGPAAQPGPIIPNASLSSGGSAGRIDPGVEAGFPAQYRLRLRVVDDRTGAVSRFIDASLIGGTLKWEDQAVEINVGVTNEILYVKGHIHCWGPTVGEGFILDHFSGPAQFRIPFKTARGTHVEFWRTTKGGINYYPEIRKALHFKAQTFFDDSLTNAPNEKISDETFSTLITFRAGALQDGEHAALNLSDFDLGRRDKLMDPDARAGGLPPMCRDIISVLGCTLAGGANKAESALLLQGKRLVWPRITHDGVIRYSEISGGFSFLYPESFHSLDFVTLTRNEDRFQRFVPSSDVVLAVYVKGVYRLTREATAIGKKQLGESGIGTPWANAILPAGKLALWVTPNAIRVFNAEVENGVGDLQTFEHGAMMQWFHDALIGGMQIDAGYDERYGTLHLRRSRVVEIGNVAAGGGIDEQNNLRTGLFGLTENDDLPLEIPLTSEDTGGVASPTLEGAKIAYYLDSSAVFNLKTGDWTLIDDDNGFRYVAAEALEDLGSGGPKLYTVDQLGGVFEENYLGSTHPYDGLVVQEKLTAARWNLNPALAIFGIYSQSGTRFSPSMAGDVVRFKSSDPLKDGLARTIRQADSAKIIFDPLPVALQEGDEFIIGAVRFKVRFAAVTGSSMRALKTIDQLEVYARPGPLHNGVAPWGTRPTSKLSVRVYRDFGNTAAVQASDEINVFDDDDPQFKSEDRYSTIAAQGRALEVEIEDSNARSDVVIDGVFMQVEDEGALVADDNNAA